LKYFIETLYYGVLTRFSYFVLFKCIGNWKVLQSIQFFSMLNILILIYHFFFGLYFFSQLKHHKKLYESYVPMEYKSYIKQMKRLDYQWWSILHFIREQTIDGNTNLIFACCFAIDQESGEIMLLYKQLQTVWVI
jgi:hypothetical protein